MYERFRIPDDTVASAAPFQSTEGRTRSGVLGVCKRRHALHAPKGKSQGWGVCDSLGPLPSKSPKPPEAGGDVTGTLCSGKGLFVGLKRSM